MDSWKVFITTRRRATDLFLIIVGGIVADLDEAHLGNVQVVGDVTCGRGTGNHLDEKKERD
jgi:hypothetical protein